MGKIHFEVAKRKVNHREHGHRAKLFVSIYLSYKWIQVYKLECFIFYPSITRVLLLKYKKGFAQLKKQRRSEQR